MKKFLIFLVLILSHFSIHAQGVELTCDPDIPACINCPEYQTLFPISNFSTSSDSLDIEADQSEILSNQNYNLTGDVKVKSDEFILAADNVVVDSISKTTTATGNVEFQDSDFLIAGDILVASRDDDKNLKAEVTNANYQDFGSGLNGANGISEFLEKDLNIVILKNATYSLCPVNKNDWLVKAENIVLNLDKNRGVADKAILKFYGVPLFYLPKYSWVLSGRGSGFLTPNYSTYTDVAATQDSFGHKKGSYSLMVPYYLNLAPDRDLLLVLTYMQSRQFIYEGKYRQLIAPKITPDHADSLLSIEAKYLPEDKMTGLKRWLVNFEEEMDISDKIHFSAKYERVSDKKYFSEIARTRTGEKSLKSFLKFSYTDYGNDLTANVLTEDEQLVNAGIPVYTKALEASVSKTFNKKSKMPIRADLVGTKFAHDTASKESGLRTHGVFGVTRHLNINYPRISPGVSVALTNYSLKNNPNINRTVFGSGLEIDFTIKKQSSMLGYKINQRITPLIRYNYRAKQVQGNIPIFDTEDKYADIITFADLTSGERYSGFDRISNANDVTLSLESSSRDANGLDDDPDLLNMRIAQSYYTDDEVVSATSNTNYEVRKSYSDIAASIDFAIGKYILNTNVQFNPDKSKIVHKDSSLTYSSNARKFITMKFSDNGTEKTEKLYGAIPLTNSIHFFGGLDKTTSTGTTNYETTGLAYETCCWAYRLAHFKENNGLGMGDYNYSTGMELVFTGLGSTSSPLKGKIESNILGYNAKLR